MSRALADAKRSATSPAKILNASLWSHTDVARPGAGAASSCGKDKGSQGSGIVATRGVAAICTLGGTPEGLVPGSYASSSSLCS